MSGTTRFTVYTVYHLNLIQQMLPLKGEKLSQSMAYSIKYATYNYDLVRNWLQIVWPWNITILKFTYSWKTNNDKIGPT